MTNMRIMPRGDHWKMASSMLMVCFFWERKGKERKIIIKSIKRI